MNSPVENLAALMNSYIAAKRQPFANHPLHALLRRIRDDFAHAEVLRAQPFLRAKAGVGQGNWAVIPWIAILDTRETSTIQNGVYVILLFCADMSGAYLTLNQGITRPAQQLGSSGARAAVRHRAEAIRLRFPEVLSQGFGVSEIDLKAPAHFSAGYAHGSVASRFFSREELTTWEEFLRALAHLVAVYERYMDAPIALGPSTF